MNTSLEMYVSSLFPFIPFGVDESHRSHCSQFLFFQAYCFHVANHITKVRSRILHHNSRLASKTEVPEEFRDQGFVRPKVLILVPFKESALRFVRNILLSSGQLFG